MINELRVCLSLFEALSHFRLHVDIQSMNSLSKLRHLLLICGTYVLMARLPHLIAGLPDAYQLEEDWLLDPSSFETTVTVDESSSELVMQNGLIRRVWRLDPNASTVSFDNLMTGASLLRAVRPEVELVLDGVLNYVGGLAGQPNHAYLSPDWLASMTADPAAFQFLGYSIGEPAERFAWKRVRHHAPGSEWPPQGKAVRLDFRKDALHISVHYEMYDGVPALSKWFELRNEGDEPVNVDRFKVEVLAIVPYEDPVEFRGVPLTPPDLHIETDYAFGGMSLKNSTRHTVHWVPDPQFQTQVNYLLQNPCLLEVGPMNGPDQTIEPGKSMSSFRVFELMFDSTDRDRKGLSQQRLYRKVAPWVTENPLMLHVVNSDPDVVRTAIDQAADCGFEIVNLSFGSGLNMEDESASNLARFRELNDYARSRGIEMGGYSLLSSRRIKPDGDNAINPETGQPGGQIHGFAPALASDWGRNYFRRLRAFFEATGFSKFVHDGSYPGDLDAASRPPFQKGAADSQWVQWRIITDFYQWMRGAGIYLRVPDYYYLSGANECGMGYREVNWSLPRLQQQIHTRQNIYDGTWQKTPSMGWMFVPLTEYHGGGEAATIEPLDLHRDHYGTMLASNLGAGVQAAYRGERLYDTASTRSVVTKWVNWYKSFREILESDVIHGSSRRADGRDLDWYFHANSNLETKGMLVVFNPLQKAVQKMIFLNVYYTGIEGEIIVRGGYGFNQTVVKDRDDRIKLSIEVPAGGVSWYALH